MRGRRQLGDLLFDPEIEETAKANRKANRLARSPDPGYRTPHTNLTFFEPETITAPVIKMGEPNPPPRPKMGDYGLAANCSRLTHVFQPANPVAFDIKTSIQNHLKDRQFDGSDNVSPHEHLSHVLCALS